MRKGRTEINSDLSVNSNSVKPDVTDINVMLNAFRIAVNGSLTQFSMVDGIVDEYEDESGISQLIQPFAHYKLNDNAANTAVTDDGTGANNGTANVNTSTLTITGKINEAFNFSADSINVDGLLTAIASDTSGSISAWVRFSGFGNYTIFGGAVGTDNRHLIFLINSSGELQYNRRINPALDTQVNVTSVETLSLNTWHHVVLVQDGVSPVFYIDGVLATNNFSDTTDVTAWFAKETMDNMDIGQRTNAQDQFAGDMDDVRYYQNKALTLAEVALIYNSGAGTEDGALGSTNISYDSVNDLYSPALGEFDTNTKLLLHLDGSDAATSTSDESNSNHSISFSGNAQLDTAQSKFGGSSCLFDGSGDWIATSVISSDFNPDTEDYTVDFWVRFIDINFNSNARQSFFSTTNTLIFGEWRPGDGEISVGWDGGGKINTPWTPVNDQWFHIALVRNGGNLQLFVDGVQLGGTVSVSDIALSSADQNIFIGSADNSGTRPLNGWIDEFRVSKGIARWTSNFTPPIEEYSPDKANMTLQSNEFIAEAEADTARIVLFEEDVDSITLNTDLIASISRDGGTTFTQATLIDEGNYESGRKILSASVDISGQPTGTDMVYKVVTVNNKDLKIHGTGLSWD